VYAKDARFYKDGTVKIDDQSYGYNAAGNYGGKKIDATPDMLSVIAQYNRDEATRYYASVHAEQARREAAARAEQEAAAREAANGTKDEVLANFESDFVKAHLAPGNKSKQSARVMWARKMPLDLIEDFGLSRDHLEEVTTKDWSDVMHSAADEAEAAGEPELARIWNACGDSLYQKALADGSAVAESAPAEEDVEITTLSRDPADEVVVKSADYDGGKAEKKAAKAAKAADIKRRSDFIEFEVRKVTPKGIVIGELLGTGRVHLCDVTVFVGGGVRFSDLEKGFEIKNPEYLARKLGIGSQSRHAVELYNAAKAEQAAKTAAPAPARQLGMANAEGYYFVVDHVMPQQVLGTVWSTFHNVEVASIIYRHDIHDKTGIWEEDEGGNTAQTDWGTKLDIAGICEKAIADKKAGKAGNVAPEFYTRENLPELQDEEAWQWLNFFGNAGAKRVIPGCKPVVTPEKYHELYRQWEAQEDFSKPAYANEHGQRMHTENFHNWAPTVGWQILYDFD
jgi:hypothetical protein